MPFSPPSRQECLTMFGDSDDEKCADGTFSDDLQLTTCPLKHPGASKRKPNREPVQDLCLSPKKLCFGDEPEQKNGYTTPPRSIVATLPVTPFKPGPSTPDDVKMTGGRLPITPGKKIRKRQ